MFMYRERFRVLETINLIVMSKNNSELFSNVEQYSPYRYYMVQLDLLFVGFYKEKINAVLCFQNSYEI